MSWLCVWGVENSQSPICTAGVGHYVGALGVLRIDGAVGVGEGLLLGSLITPASPVKSALRNCCLLRLESGA